MQSRQNIKKQYISLFLFVMGFLGGGDASAQIRAPEIPEPPVGFTNLNQVITSGITILFIVAGLAVLVYIVLGSFTYLTAGADEDKTKKARSIIVNAVVGLMLVAASWAGWEAIVGFIPGLSGLLGL